MTTITLIARTQDAVAYSDASYQSTDNNTTYNAPGKVHTSGYASVIISADNLAGAEEVDLYYSSGGTAKLVINESGTTQKLTATISALELKAGPTYMASKDATTGDCGVYAILNTQ